jgi:hypothetical protein
MERLKTLERVLSMFLWMLCGKSRRRTLQSVWIIGLCDTLQIQRTLGAYVKVCWPPSYQKFSYNNFVYVTILYQIRQMLTAFHADIAAKFLSTPEKASLPTILQFSSEDRFTKYEICQLFAEIMGLSLEHMKPNTEGNDPNSPAQRPYDCHLSTKSLKDIGIPVHTQDFKGWWRRECRATRR